MGKWKVYCYTGKNNKKYIGITSFSLSQRAGKNGEKYMRDDFAFGKAIKKYGFSFFTSEILEDGLTHEQACEKEKYYIQLFNTYKNGYNCTLGGDGKVKFEKEEILKLWEQGKNHKEIEKEIGCKNITIQRVLCSYEIDGMERIKKSAGKYHMQEVHKYDLQGNYIESYSSYSEAGRANNVPHINIIKCIQNKRQTCGGFQWSIEKVDKMLPYKKNIGFHKKIYQFNLQGELLKEYECVISAARENNYLPNYLAKCAKKNMKAYGFYWSYTKTLEKN